MVDRQGGVIRIGLTQLGANDGSPPGLLDELLAVLHRADSDRECDVLVLIGADKLFCGPRNAGHDASTCELYREIADTLNHLRPMTIAIVGKGYEPGDDGLDLNLTCDLVISANNSEPNKPTINWAITPASTGATKLARLVERFEEFELQIFNMIAEPS